jgi:hypothetical protein
MSQNSQVWILACSVTIRHNLFQFCKKHYLHTYVNCEVYYVCKGHAVVQLVEAPRYRSEGHRFDCWWCHWSFSLTYSFQLHYGPGFSSVSNRHEYQEYFLGVKGGGWCRGLMTLPPSCAKYIGIWEPQPPGTLRACPGLYRDCFTFTCYVCKGVKKWDLFF